jgi:hypothetical protein
VKNVPDKIAYAIVGGALGLAASLALVELLADYFMLGEAAIIFFYFFPFVVMMGVISGTIYSRK